MIPPAILHSSLAFEVFTGRAFEGHVKAMISHSPNKKYKFFLMKTSVCERTPTITEEIFYNPINITVQVRSQDTRICPLVEMYPTGLKKFSSVVARQWPVIPQLVVVAILIRMDCII